MLPRYEAVSECEPTGRAEKVQGIVQEQLPLVGEQVAAAIELLSRYTATLPVDTAGRTVTVPVNALPSTREAVVTLIEVEVLSGAMVTPTLPELLALKLLSPL